MFSYGILSVETENITRVNIQSLALRIIASTRTEALCPYCRSSLLVSLDIVTCSSCKTLHHRNCFDELKRCSVFGCKGEAEQRKASRPVSMFQHGTSSKPFVALGLATVLGTFLSIAFPHWIFSALLLMAAFFGIGLLMKMKAFMSGSALFAALLFLILPCWESGPGVVGLMSSVLSVGVLIIAATRLLMVCPSCGLVRKTESKDGLVSCPECSVRFAS